MNVAPVAPSPTPARAADTPSPAAGAFGDLLAATPTIQGTPAASADQPGSTPAMAASNAPANAQPVAIKASVADHLPTPPAPRSDGPDAQPAPVLAPTDPGQPAEVATAATPVVASQAEPPPAPAVAPSSPTPVAMADALASHALPWQQAVAGDGVTPKPVEDGGESDTGHDASGAGKPRSTKADPATASSDTQGAQPVMLAVTPAAPAIPQPGAGSAPQGSDGTDAVETAAGGTGAPAAPLAPRDAVTAAPVHAGSDNLPPLLASQTPGAAIAPPAGQAPSYASTPVPQASHVVVAEPGRIGRDIGVEIARHVAAGRDEVMIRLSPAEMGRIDVRLSFDGKGALHAAVSADSPQALDMLRRDAGDLGRSLADAGIRTDSSTFSFDSRDSSAGQFAQQQGHAGGDGRQRHPGTPFRDADGGEPLDAVLSPYRQLRASGRVDLMA